MDLLCVFFCFGFAMTLCASVYMCLVAPALLALVCGVCEFNAFPLISWVRCGS